MVLRQFFLLKDLPEILSTDPLQLLKKILFNHSEDIFIQNTSCHPPPPPLCPMPWALFAKRARRGRRGGEGRRHGVGWKFPMRVREFDWQERARRRAVTHTAKRCMHVRAHTPNLSVGRACWGWKGWDVTEKSWQLGAGSSGDMKNKSRGAPFSLLNSRGK